MDLPKLSANWFSYLKNSIRKFNTWNCALRLPFWKYKRINCLFRIYFNFREFWKWKHNLKRLQWLFYLLFEMQVVLSLCNFDTVFSTSFKKFFLNTTLILLQTLILIPFIRFISYIVDFFCAIYNKYMGMKLMWMYA